MNHPAARTLAVLVLLALGPPGLVAQILPAPDLLSLSGESPGDAFGQAVDFISDLDGDQIDDVIVGSPNADASAPRSGRVRIYSGATGAVIRTFDGLGADDGFGSSVSRAGDVDGDDVEDLIVGAWQRGLVPFGPPIGPGYAIVYSGATGGVLETFVGTAINDLFGTSVSGAGDVDGDGLDDVIIGASQAPLLASQPNEFGYARVYSVANGNLLQSFSGAFDRDRLGESVDGAGDFDDDGHADLFVGVPGDDTAALNAGAARIYSGATGALLFEWLGPGTNHFLGEAVSRAGDVNGDGVGDYIIGMPGFPGFIVPSGKAQVFSGADQSLLHEFTGQAPADRLGEAVAGAGDVNGDGFADLVVGAIQAVSGAPGFVRVFSGFDGAILDTTFGGSPDLRFGSVVAGGGDLSGDGLADVIGGGPGDSSGNVTGGALVPRIGPFPGFVAPTPCGVTFDLSVGVPISFDVATTLVGDLFGGTITLSVDDPDGVLQRGATLTPPLPVTGVNPTTTFDWTPGHDVGMFPLVFIATDAQGQEARCGVGLGVAECYLFAGLQPANITLGPGATLLTRVDWWWPVTAATMPDLELPDLPILNGLTLYFQLGMHNPMAFPNQPLHLSNGLMVTLGSGASMYGPITDIELGLWEPPILGGNLSIGFVME